MTITAEAAMINPEIVAFVARHISASPWVRSFALKIGMNAAVSAPSPSKRRKRLGIMKAIAKAPATGVSPIKRA